MSQHKKKHASAEDGKKIRPFHVAIGAVLVVLIILTASVAYIFHLIQDPGKLFTGTVPVITPSPKTPSPTAVGSVSTVPGTLTPLPPPTEEPPPDYQFTQERLNILMLGADSSTERIQAGMNFRTDTILLVSIDFVNNKVDMISIPRDSYVRINGGERRTKINAAFVYGGGAKKDGYQYAMDTLEWTLGGINIDYYVGFGMQVVKDVVDAMGGIDYDVDISFTMNGRKLEKGTQHLDGQKALDYARYRGTARGDIDRVDRQQRILFEVFKQMKSTDQIGNIPKIYSAFSSSIDTNLELIQIAALAYWARNLDLENIQRHTLAGYGLMIGNVSYYVLDQSKKVALVKEIFGQDIVVPAGEDYGTIKAQTEAVGQKVAELQTMIFSVQQGIASGLITDPGVQYALATGQAALLTEKIAEIESALNALRPYASYQTSYNPYDPNATQPAQQVG